VVPAAVVFVDESGIELLQRPTLGDAPARVVYHAPEGHVLDGLAVRPDGSAAIVGVRAGPCTSSVFSVDLATGAARELISEAAEPLLSPDGAWLAYVRVALVQPACPQVQLVVRNVASGVERALGSPQVRYVDSWSWSPDSLRLAFLDCAPQCSLSVLDVGSGTTVAFGSTAEKTDRDASGISTSISLSIARPVGWSIDGSVFATGRCACAADGTQVVGAWDAQERPTLYAAFASVPERTIAFAGDNELVVSTLSEPKTVHRRHGGGPLIDLGVRSNGLAAWPSAQPWRDPVPPTADGLPSTIFTVARGAVLELESTTGAVVRVLHAAADGWAESFALDRGNNRAFVGEMLAGCGSQMVSMPLDGGPSTVVGAGVQPALSPDGSHLAYVAQLWARTATEPVTPEGIGCAYSVLVVRDLRTGEEREVLPPRFVPGEPSTGSWELGGGAIKWSPDGLRFAYLLGYEGASTYVVDLVSLTATLVAATSAIDAELTERLGGYPEFAPQAWAGDGLHLASWCYGCGVAAIHVRATDGRTIDEVLAGPQPPLDTRNGHALVVDSPGDRPPALARVDRDGNRVLLRADTSVAVWR
jgi:hypothetical protein